LKLDIREGHGFCCKYTLLISHFSLKKKSLFLSTQASYVFSKKVLPMSEHSEVLVIQNWTRKMFLGQINKLL
jgi:hypothetical protein